MSKPLVPAVEGWFTMPPVDDVSQLNDAGVPGVKLIGTRCTDSGTYFFPPERVMSRAPGFADSELVEVELSTRGRLWSYTDAQYQPPEPFVPSTDPYEPVCLAAVELEHEQLVVLGQVIPGVSVDDLRIGMEMELVLGTLNEDDDGHHVVWKWRPVTASTTAAERTAHEGAA